METESGVRVDSPPQPSDLRKCAGQRREPSRRRAQSALNCPQYERVQAEGLKQPRCPAETSSQWGTRSALPPLRGLPFQSLGSGRVAEIEACRADTLPFSSLPLSYARPLRTSHYRSVSGPRRVGSDLHSKRRLALPLGVVPVDRECRPRGQRTATGWGTALERPMSPGVGTAR